MTVRVANGQIIVSFGDEDEHLSPDEARQLADKLTAAATECERQQREVEATCESEGHDWGAWLNGYAPWRNHARRCQRGCKFGYEQEPGWMPFAGLPHRDPFTGRDLECAGPGCEHCDSMRLGAAIRELFADVRERIDAWVLTDSTS